MNKEKKKSYQSGIWAEYAAMAYLFFRGYKILKRRFKSPVGEIDLIAENRKTLVFVEVKYRRTRAEALNSITPKMKYRIQKAAEYYISHAHKTGLEKDMRFDVVVLGFKKGVQKPFSFFISHLDNAWEAKP